MAFEETIERYAIDGAREEFYASYTGPYDADFTPYLTEAYLMELNRYLRLDRETIAKLVSVAARLSENAALCALAAYARALLFCAGFSEEQLQWLRFPHPHTGDRELDDCFALLVHLSGFPVVQERYAARGISDAVLSDTYRSVRIWIEAFYRFYGRFGHDREPRMVFIEHLRILRLGRLEFERNAFTGAVVGLMHRRTGELAAVCEGGVFLRRDGLINGTNDVVDLCAVKTTYTENAAGITAHRVVPDGHAALEPAFFPFDEWAVFLRRGYASLNMHIPRDGRLCAADALAAMEEARAFFPAHFPETAFTAFECHTWLFESRLCGLLPEDSGIVAFQKLFCRFPECSGDLGLRYSAFTEAPFDMRSWQPETRLQRAVIDYYKAGGVLCQCGGFLPFGN